MKKFKKLNKKKKKTEKGEINNRIYEIFLWSVEALNNLIIKPPTCLGIMKIEV